MVRDQREEWEMHDTGVWQSAGHWVCSFDECSVCSQPASGLQQKFSGLREELKLRKNEDLTASVTGSMAQLLAKHGLQPGGSSTSASGEVSAPGVRGHDARAFAAVWFGGVVLGYSMDVLVRGCQDVAEDVELWQRMQGCVQMWRQ